jgi:DNA-binding transcriptional MerR regulator
MQQGNLGNVQLSSYLASYLEEILQLADNPEKEIYRIGDLADEFGVTLRTLRFYEDRGLISPQRSGSTRLYSQRDRMRFKIILLAKRIGFSLVEIREYLDIYDSNMPVDEQLSKILPMLNAQTGVLKVQRVEIDNSLRELEKVIETISNMAEQN